MLWKKHKKNQKINEVDKRNVGTWVRILSFMFYLLCFIFYVYSWQGTEATAHNIMINETLVQVLIYTAIYRTLSFKKYCGWKISFADFWSSVYLPHL